MRDVPSHPRSCRSSANRRAARIGPTVCELDGPTPILKISKMLVLKPTLYAMLLRKSNRHIRLPAYPETRNIAFSHHFGSCITTRRETTHRRRFSLRVYSLLKRIMRLPVVRFTTPGWLAKPTLWWASSATGSYGTRPSACRSTDCGFPFCHVRGDVRRRGKSVAHPPMGSSRRSFGPPVGSVPACATRRPHLDLDWEVLAQQAVDAREGAPTAG